MEASSQYCKVCGTSLRDSARGPCKNGCCADCHRRYCSRDRDHYLDVEHARHLHGMRVLYAIPKRPAQDAS
jgi:hypothetical protein